MDPILISSVIPIALIALYFLVFRPMKGRSGTGRPDELERPEMRGEEQHKKRDLS